MLGGGYNVGGLSRVGFVDVDGVGTRGTELLLEN